MSAAGRRAAVPLAFDENTFGQDYFSGGSNYAGRYDWFNPPHKIAGYLREIRRLRPAGSLLDVGCAFGRFLQAARHHYECEGVDISVYATGLARERLPDVMLLDVMMPKLSGFEVCSRLRADPATQDISILMITALDQSSDVGKAVDAGTDDFITKPINKTELLLRVRAMLASRSETNEVDRTLAYIGRVLQGL